MTPATKTASVIGAQNSTGYLGFPSSPVIDDINRSRKQSQTRIEQAKSVLRREGNFTASDFSELRNVLPHIGSSTVVGTGAKYSPFHSTRMQVFDDDSQLVIGYDATSSPKSNGTQNDCRIKSTINLTPLPERMKKGVASFLNDYHEFDKEKGKGDYLT